ncbi:MAG: hypothetical protein ACKVOW_06065 [Chitinophagaceae bacterium]
MHNKKQLIRSAKICLRTGRNKKETAGIQGLAGRYRRNLSVLLLMAVLSQSFFTLVRRNFMTLSFFTTRHDSLNDLV